MAHLLSNSDAMTVYIGCPGEIGGDSGKAVLADFYSRLLGWHQGDAYGTPFVSRSPRFRLGFDGDGWSDQRPPRWPDPAYPQQIHLDVSVPDLNAAEVTATAAGGRLLEDKESSRIYADPAGHPFCLYPDSQSSTNGPRVARLVYDCVSPRSLAMFYEGFLGVQGRLEDSAERVVIDLDDDELPNLAFQQSWSDTPRWPDPAYPAQLHVDYRFSDDEVVPHFQTPEARAAMARAEDLGAIHLRHVVYADPAGHPFCF